MKYSGATGLPGQSMIGTRVRSVILSVSVPMEPASTKPAVACTIRRGARGSTSSWIRARFRLAARPTRRALPRRTRPAGSRASRVLDLHVLGDPGWWIGDFNRGHPLVVEDPKRRAEPEVYARRLRDRGVPWTDLDPPLERPWRRLVPWPGRSRLRGHPRNSTSRTAAPLATLRVHMPTPGPLEMIIILVVVLLVFGPKRLPDLGRSLGAGCASSRTR